MPGMVHVVGYMALVQEREAGAGTPMGAVPGGQPQAGSVSE